MSRPVLVACLLVLLASCRKEAPAPQPGIAWVKGIDEALSRSKTSGKPVLLHFYATW